ncbi:MAG: hypothetical protein GY829_04395, partial [Gammaproteobacteria bacterium]|nr:hypothetical protein [Gammaproteobacteria bacterium]
MTNICPGIFKKAFEKPGFSFNLACQLTTGADTFNYMIPTDPTLYSSDNNLFSNNEQYGSAANSSTHTWIGADFVTGLAMNRAWAWNSRTPAVIPDAEPALTRSTTDARTPITIGESFVAKNGRFVVDSYPGGTHIKIINGVKYITSYTLANNPSWTIKLQKHQVIYDPNIDQATITDMPIVDTIILDSYGDIMLPLETEVCPWDPIHGGYCVKQANWARENRQMTCNRDGTKTIFSVARGSKDSENYNIFVLTDDDNGFSVELYDVFYKSETLESNTAETINYTGSGTLD